MSMQRLECMFMEGDAIPGLGVGFSALQPSPKPRRVKLPDSPANQYCSWANTPDPPADQRRRLATPSSATSSAAAADVRTGAARRSGLESGIDASSSSRTLTQPLGHHNTKPTAPTAAPAPLSH